MEVKQIIKAFAAFVAIVCGAACFCSCEGNGGKNDNGDNDTTKVDPKNTPKPVLTNDTIVAGVVLYLDASASMNGYVAPSKDTNFGAVVVNIEALVPGGAHSYLYGDKPVAADCIGDKISNQELELDAKESNLCEMVSLMARKACNSDTVYFLVTDGILSGTNKQIEKSREYNIASRKALSQRVRNNLEPYNGDVASMVLQFSAPFKGTYWNYKNGMEWLKDVMRPYYVIAFGRKAQLQKVYADIKKDSGTALARYENEALYGFDYGLGIPKLVQVKQRVQPRGDNKWFVSDRVDSFDIKYDVSQLPAKMLANSDSLVQHTKVYGGKKEALPADKYKVAYANKVLNIAIQDKSALDIPGEMAVRIEWWQPSWIEEKTDTLDNDPRNMKTFNLKYLLEPFSVLNSDKYIDNENIIQLTKK